MNRLLKAVLVLFVIVSIFIIIIYRRSNESANINMTQNHDRLCIIINTCKPYFKTIVPLINEINVIDPAKRFPRKNIFIISGQEDTDTESFIQDIKVIRVQYTGIHLTSFIYVSQNMTRFPFDYFLMLPDTIHFGIDFFTRVQQFSNTLLRNNAYTCYPLIDWELRPSMDMGIVSRSHFEFMKDFLQRIKMKKPYETRSLKELKRTLIYLENAVLGQYHPVFGDKHYDYNKIHAISSQPNDIDENIITVQDKEINVVHIKKLDLYKYQRNFRGPNVDVVMSL